MTPARPRVLVTGATGYIGGRLVPGLLEAGYTVRCLARSTRKLAARRWASDPNVEMVEADLQDIESDGRGGARLWTRLLSRPLDGLDGLAAMPRPTGAWPGRSPRPPSGPGSRASSTWAGSARPAPA